MREITNSCGNPLCNKSKNGGTLNEKDNRTAPGSCDAVCPAACSNDTGDTQTSDDPNAQTSDTQTSEPSETDEAEPSDTTEELSGEPILIGHIADLTAARP